MAVDRRDCQIRLRREEMIKAPLFCARPLADVIHAYRSVALFPNELHGRIQQLLFGITFGFHVTLMRETSPLLTDQSSKNLRGGNPGGVEVFISSSAMDYTIIIDAIE